MPKLNNIQIADRLRNKLEDLRNGKEVSARDLRALLTDEQEVMLDTLWEAQQELRTKKRARTKKEERELGWRSKREIQIEVLEQVIRQANDQMLQTLMELQHKSQIRQARIFLEGYSKARNEAKSDAEARTAANNDLTRAGLRRVGEISFFDLSKRDREVWEIETQLKKQLKIQMSPEELEQIEFLEAQEKAWAKKLKKQK